MSTNLINSKELCFGFYHPGAALNGPNHTNSLNHWPNSLQSTLDFYQQSNFPPGLEKNLIQINLNVQDEKSNQLFEFISTLQKIMSFFNEQRNKIFIQLNTKLDQFKHQLDLFSPNFVLEEFRSHTINFDNFSKLGDELNNLLTKTSQSAAGSETQFSQILKDCQNQIKLDNELYSQSKSALNGILKEFKGNESDPRTPKTPKTPEKSEKCGRHHHTQDHSVSPLKVYEAQTSLKTKISGDCIEVTVTEKADQKLYLVPQGLNHLKEFVLNLGSIESISSPDIQLLYQIKKLLPNLENLRIKVQDAKLEEKLLIRVFWSLFSGQTHLKKIEIDMHQKPTLSKKGIIKEEESVQSCVLKFFAKKCLAQIKSLESLDINLKFARISNQAVGILIKNILPFSESLTSLSLQLTQAEFTEETINRLFVEMPELETLKLNFGSTVFSDVCLKKFSEITLTSARNLEVLDLGLIKAQIGDEGCEVLLNNIPQENLRELTLNFSQTKICSGCFQMSFGKKWKRGCENLSFFDIGVTNIVPTGK